MEAYSSTVSKICFDEKDALVNLKNNQEYSEEYLCENWTDPETIAFIIWLDVKNTDDSEQKFPAFDDNFIWDDSWLALMDLDGKFSTPRGENTNARLDSMLGCLSSGPSDWWEVFMPSVFY